VWTGEAWTTVLAGAVSQWKRSDGGSAASGPRGRVPGGDLLEHAQALADRPRVDAGRQRAQPGVVEQRARHEELTVLAGEDDDARVEHLAALDVRHDAQQRVLERPTRHGPPPPPRRSRAARRAGRAGTPRTGAVADPVLGHELRDRVERQVERPEPRVDRPERRGVREQDVVGDLPERAARDRREVRDAVLQEQRGAVVDQPQVAVPDEHVRVARGAVDVHDQRVEPHDRRGQLGVQALARALVVGQRAGQEVHADVQAGRRGEEVLDLLVGLGDRQVGGQVDEDELGTGSPSARPSSPATISAASALGPCPRRGT
jgi:hypothetical protein